MAKTFQYRRGVRPITEEETVKGDKIAQLIYAAYEKAAKTFDGYRIPVGMANGNCDRAIWYAFHWASVNIPHDGKMLRLFKTGQNEEERVIRDLEMIGISVYGKQDEIIMASGHMRGKIDGKCIGIPDNEHEVHLLEAKTVSAKNMRKLKAVKVELFKPEYYGQCQLGMLAFDLPKCLFVAVCKDTDEIHTEIVEFDKYAAAGLLARMIRIVERPNPPARMCKDREDFCGRFCKQKEVCFFDVAPRKNCRTCLHSTPETKDEKGTWSCARNGVDLSYGDQPKGCEKHLYIPGLVPGEVIDSDKENETVTYLMDDGTEWTNVCGFE